MGGGRHFQPPATRFGKRVAIAKLEDNPVFENLMEFLSATVQRGRLGPDAPESRNRAVEPASVQDLVLGHGHGGFYVNKESHAMILHLSGADR